jgi:hypothetical protein
VTDDDDKTVMNLPQAPTREEFIVTSPLPEEEE